jgi:hypothetical protein
MSDRERMPAALQQMAARPSIRVAALDGLRGLAVLSVVFRDPPCAVGREQFRRASIYRGELRKAFVRSSLTRSREGRGDRARTGLIGKWRTRGSG